MDANHKSKLKLFLLPLLVLCTFGLLLFAYKFFDLPSKGEIITKAQDYYSRHGYITVFIGAAIEGLLFVNWYFPGSVIVITGVVFARSIGLNVVGVVGLISLGFFITSLFNYFLGRYGWYHVLVRFGLGEPLENIKSKVQHRGLILLFATYFHPNIGALVATSAGILKLDFKKFALYSFLATVLWNSIWGTVVYLSGPFILNLLGPWLTGSVLVLGTAYYSYKRYKEKTPDQSI